FSPIIQEIPYRIDFFLSVYSIGYILCEWTFFICFSLAYPFALKVLNVETYKSVFEKYAKQPVSQ
ncbi:hypothetical protein ACM6Q5_24990, partial [Bacillus pseudomycoides]